MCHILYLHLTRNFFPFVPSRERIRISGTYYHHYYMLCITENTYIPILCIFLLRCEMEKGKAFYESRLAPGFPPLSWISRQFERL